MLICLLKKVCTVVFHILPTYRRKPIINTCLIVMQTNHLSILCTWTLIKKDGYAMSQCLPTGGFKWFSQKQIEKVNLATCAADSKKGMIMEVDLEYPRNCMSCIMNILLRRKKLKLTKRCSLLIVKTHRKNMVSALDK